MAPQVLLTIAPDHVLASLCLHEVVHARLDVIEFGVKVCELLLLLSEPLVLLDAILPGIFCEFLESCEHFLSKVQNYVCGAAGASADASLPYTAKASQGGRCQGVATHAAQITVNLVVLVSDPDVCEFHSTLRIVRQ